MGTSRSFAELADKLAASAGKIRTDQEILRSSALTVTKAVRTELRTAAPSGRMSGVGRNGARVNARYDQLRNGRSILVRMTGPAHLLERDTDPHVIRPKRSRTRRGKGKRTAVAFDGVVRGTVRHPGTRGKKPWEKGVKKSQAPVRRDFAAGVSNLLGEVF